jgi:integrase
VKLDTRLSRRGDRFYFRMRVPRDLQGYFPQKREIRISLNTGNRAVARRLAAERSAKLLMEIEAVRAKGLQHLPRDVLGRFPEETLLQINRHLSHNLTEVPYIDDEFITKVCMTYLRHRIDGDASARADPVAGGYAHTIGVQEGQADLIEHLRKALSLGEVEEVKPLLRRFIAEHEFKITGDPPGFRLLLMRFLEAEVRAEEATAARNLGQPVDIDALAPIGKTFFGEGNRPFLPLCRIVDAWDRAKTRRPKTVAEYRTVAADFEDFLRSNFKIRGMEVVSRVHVRAYRDHLFDSEQSYKTVLKKIGILKSLFGHAVTEEILATNACERVKVEAPQVRPKARVSFSAADLAAIFASDVYRGEMRITGCGEHAAFFLPLLALFGGMRLEELCQLRVRDVQRDADLGWLVSINDEAGKTIKTHSSRRSVPVHPELIRIGFLRFVKFRGKGNELLFPDLTLDKYQRRGSRFSKQWNKHLRGILHLKDEDHTKSFHSFRHTFKDNCRRVGMTEEIHDALTGHKSGATEGRKYGSGSYPLPPLFKQVKRYQVPQLNLMHVKWSAPVVANIDGPDTASRLTSYG